jgi:cob(I)alamin adenosyltransferase
MKIYTRTGDQGETGLIGERRSKDNQRVEAYGTIDELNAFIGEAIVRLQEETYADMRKDLTIIQHQLFDAGGDLAQVGENPTYRVKSEMVDALEYLIDRYDKECSALSNFIVPGGTPQSAAFHLCRVISRRAERRVVTLCLTETANEEIRRYLNRLSDFFFVLARVANVRAGQTDIPYKRDQELE